MNPVDRLFVLVEGGHQILARERELLLRGDLARAALLCADKQALLASLDAVIPRVRATTPVRDAIMRLIEDGRRNERLILAARQGLALARRRLEAIAAMLRGAVAYDRDGARISCRDDAAEKSKRA